MLILSTLTERASGPEFRGADAGAGMVNEPTGLARLPRWTAWRAARLGPQMAWDSHAGQPGGRQARPSWIA